MPKMRTSFQGLVKLLAKSLYPEPDVFVRELIQNAHDSIALRRRHEPQLAGAIHIYTDREAHRIRFEDNGRGMDKADIEELLSVIGRSGTGEASAALADHDQAVDTIGQFGIGLLSAFVVAERIDVLTRKTGDSEVWHWSNQGGEDYELDRASEPREPGTTVTVSVGAEHLAHLDSAAIKGTVRKYADFLPYPIQVNGEGPVNAMDAPWHRGRAAYSGAEDYRDALSKFLNERYPDVPMHVIPVELETPAARGALYISDQHVPGINTTGVVDIYQGRMSIRPREQELLPEWAKFVRSVELRQLDTLDSPDLYQTLPSDEAKGYYNLEAALRRALQRVHIERVHPRPGASPRPV